VGRQSGVADIELLKVSHHAHLAEELLALRYEGAALCLLPTIFA
jgi:hypothetical protein